MSDHYPARVVVHMHLADNARQQKVAVAQGDTLDTLIADIWKVARAKFKLSKRSGAAIFFVDGETLSEQYEDRLFENKNISLVVSKTGAVPTNLIQQIEEVFIGGKCTVQALTEPSVAFLHRTAYCEEEALKQLRQAVKQLTLFYAFGMPDLHAGKGCPIGSATVSPVIYPHLVGTDAGCGMLLCQSHSVKANSAKAAKLARRLTAERMEGGLGDAFCERARGNLVPATDTDSTHLGTIGAGNHFAEAVRVHEVHDEHQFRTVLDLDEAKLFLLVHSGSRLLGKELLSSIEDAHGANCGVLADAPAGTEYLRAHNACVEWARLNRAVIALRFLCAIQDADVHIPEEADTLSTASDDPLRYASALLAHLATPILDITHNYVQAVPYSMFDERADVDARLYIHRKGAANAHAHRFLVIPGSRGDLSYLVRTTADNDVQRRCGFSAAHGAGRRLTRSRAREGTMTKTRKEALERTSFGSEVICEDANLLLEEAPSAYKDVACVVDDLVQCGLVSVVCTFEPVVTYKTRR